MYSIHCTYFTRVLDRNVQCTIEPHSKAVLYGDTVTARERSSFIPLGRKHVVVRLFSRLHNRVYLCALLLYTRYMVDCPTVHVHDRWRANHTRHRTMHPVPFLSCGYSEHCTAVVCATAKPHGFILKQRTNNTHSRAVGTSRSRLASGDIFPALYVKVSHRQGTLTATLLVLHTNQKQPHSKRKAGRCRNNIVHNHVFCCEQNT